MFGRINPLFAVGKSAPIQQRKLLAGRKAAIAGTPKYCSDQHQKEKAVEE